MRLWLALALALTSAVPAAASRVLEKVVVLQRHGVRSPTRPVSDYAAYSPTPFAAWPVKPGELTDHGAAALARMESRIAIEEIAKRWRRLEVDESGLKRVNMSNVAGYSNVPVAAVRH